MIARFNGNVVPFADDATLTNRTVFGGTTQSDDINDNLNADFKKGWEIVGLNDNPTREDFNAMGYTLGALISYLYEMGISEWNASQNYRVNSRVIGSDGKIYKALTGTTGTPNVGNNPTSDSVNWKDDLLDFLDTSTLPTATTELTASDFVIVMDSTVPKKITLTNFTQELTASSETASGIIELATTTETQTGTDDSRAITPLKLKNSVIGMGQTWQDVTGSKTSGNTYTNSSGKPIEVSITFTLPSASTGGDLLVDGSIRSSASRSSAATFAGTIVTALNAIVPTDTSYRFNVTGAVVITNWEELR